MVALVVHKWFGVWKETCSFFFIGVTFVIHWLRTWDILQKVTSRALVAAASQQVAQAVIVFFSPDYMGNDLVLGLIVIRVTGFSLLGCMLLCRGQLEFITIVSTQRTKWFFFLNNSAYFIHSRQLHHLLDNSMKLGGSSSQVQLCFDCIALFDVFYKFGYAPGTFKIKIKDYTSLLCPIWRGISDISAFCKA